MNNGTVHPPNVTVQTNLMTPPVQSLDRPAIKPWYVNVYSTTKLIVSKRFGKFTLENPITKLVDANKVL